MNFRFRNATAAYPSTTVALPKTLDANRRIGGWVLDVPAEWKPRLSLGDRFQQDGAVVQSDRRISSRQIRGRFSVVANGQTTDALARAALNELIGFFMPENAPFYLEDTDNNIRCQIELSGITPASAGKTAYRAMLENGIDFEMISAYWEELAVQTQSTPSGGVSNGGTFPIINDSNLNCYPAYSITALADISRFSITNGATDLGFELEDLGFETGSVFIVDAQAGTITLDGVEKSAALISGGFVYLAPGTNTFTYESEDGGVTVSTAFRRRYAF